MKKYIIIPLIIFLLVSNTMNVNAAHQHSENCYVVQEHVHTGNETSGGGCYGAVNYHVHTGDSVNGGGCYGAANHHVHSGNATSGGGCYGAANYHVHSGDAANGGGCYETANYHVHSGDAVTEGGCYTTPVTCGGTIVATTITVSCARSKGGYIGKTSWPCSCGGTVWQEGWYVVHTCDNTANETTYYEVKCDSCDKYYTRGAVGAHNGTKIGYSCSVCGRNAAGGTCTRVTGYTVSCGKTEQTPESYSLSCGKTTDTVTNYSLNCGKTTDTVGGYSLNCGKTTETVESYSLNCEYQENPVVRTPICTLGGNAYADTKEIGIGKKYRRVCFEDRIFMAGRGKQTRYWQLLCFKGL